jgi:hypothetical protein
MMLVFLVQCSYINTKNKIRKKGIFTYVNINPKSDFNMLKALGVSFSKCQRLPLAVPSVLPQLASWEMAFPLSKSEGKYESFPILFNSSSFIWSSKEVQSSLLPPRREVENQRSK